MQKNKISNLVPDSTPINPLVENVILKNNLAEKDEQLKQKDEELKNLRKLLKEATAENKKLSTTNYAQCGDRRKGQIILEELEHINDKFGENSQEVINRVPWMKIVLLN
uniref:Uncharacterized protein n=1 Tax=Panagrolaimus davidi TaxID=227884 RepID=A0A914PS56_9BILA